MGDRATREVGVRVGRRGRSLRGTTFLAAALSLAGGAAALAQSIGVGGRVEGPDREPEPSVRVELHRSLTREVQARAALEGGELEPLASTRTDAEGRFALAAPGPGMFTLVFRAPGRLTSTVSLEPLFEPIELDAVVMQAAARISITVRDGAGAPVGGARVTLREDEDPIGLALDREPTAPLARHATTDASGVARLDAKEGAAWSATVAAPGFAPGSLDAQTGAAASVTLSPGRPRALTLRDTEGGAVAEALVLLESSGLPRGVTAEDGTIAVDAPSDEPRALVLLGAGPGAGRVRLEPLPAAAPSEPLEVRLETVALKGSVVVAKTRAPIAGAWVWDAATPAGYVETDREGGYELEASPVRSGAVRVVADAPNALQESAPADPARAERGEGPPFALRLGARVLGEVVDADGRAVAGAEVRRTVSLRGAGFGLRRRPVRSGADGRFVLSAVEADRPVTLRVRADGFSPESVELEPIAAGAERRVTVELAAGRRALGTVVDLSDVPVAGARVSLRETMAGGGGLEAMIERQLSGGEPALEASTDGEGRFAIGDLAPGRYDLEVRAEGFAPARVPSVVVPAETTDTEIGTVALSPGVAVEGIVRTDDGAPLAGVEVRVREEGGVFAAVIVGTGLRESPADATTGADGRFRIGDLADGATVRIEAELAGFGPVRVQGVRAPTEEPLELVLKPASTLRGSVVDSLGEGIPGAALRLTAEMGSGGIDIARIRSMMRSDLTDEQGKFELADVVPGRYELRAVGGGFQEGRQAGIEVVAGRDPEAIRLVLEKGALLRGQVLAEDGDPVVGARVSRVEQRRTPFDFGSMQRGSSTDAEGRYRLEGLPPGPSSISVEHDRHPKQVRDFVVQPGENLLDFRLENGREIAGRLVDETGLPVAGATVSARQPTGGFTITIGEQGDPVTDERGEFTIEGLADGSYRVTARKSGYAEAASEELVRVDGRSVYGLELRMPVGAAIVGQVLGLEFDELARVEVMAMQPGATVGPTMGQVDYEGQYRLDNVASGDWLVIARVGDGAKSVRKTVTVEPGAAEVLLDLDFGGGYAIRGQVIRAGEPVRGSTVFAVGKNTTSTSQATTDQDGRFVLLNLESDLYRVAVASLGTGSAHEEEVEVAGADAEVLIELRESAVSGRVIDALDGTPVPGAAIALSPVDDDSLLATFGGFGTPPESGPGGGFRVDGVSPGTWLVRAARDGYATGTAQIEVADGVDVEGIEIELEPARGLTLVVATAAGRPADQVTVVALDAADRIVLQGQYSAGEGGVVPLDELPAGSWTLLVAGGSGATASVEATAPGEDVPVRLPESGGLRVTVPELEGTGLQAQLRILDASGRPYRSALFFQVTSKWTVSDGVARLPAVPVGTWTLEIGTPDGARSWSAVARVVPGTTLDVVVQ